MRSRHDSVYKLGLLFAAWVCFAGTCGSTQPQKAVDRKLELDKFNVEQLDLCGSDLRAGYWHKDGGKLAFEAEQVNYRGRDLDVSSEEKARGVTWKYEQWFEVKRYRVREGDKWSSWKMPTVEEKFGTIEIYFESDRWVIKPTADKFTKGDCASFKKIGE